MNRWKKGLALGLALAMAAALAACGGQTAPGQEEAPSQTGQAASSAPEEEASQEEGSLPQDLEERTVPGTGAVISLPARYEEEESGQEGVLQASTGETIVMVAVRPKGEMALEERIAAYRETMAGQMGSEGTEVEPPALSVGTGAYAVLYQGSLEGTSICNYGLFFSTGQSDVFFQVTGLEQGWEEELDQLLDCLSTFRQ